MNATETPTRPPLEALDVAGSIAVVAILAALYAIGALASPAVIVLAPIVAGAGYLRGRQSGLVAAAAGAVAYGALLALDPPADAAAWWLLTALALGAVAEIAGRAQASLARLAADLQRSVRTDALTGLLNRRAFEHEFDLELERSRRSARPVSLMVADLDNFREMNEKLGHHAGDSALEQFGEMLAERARRVDVAARVDGEAFAMLLPGTDEAGAYMFAERVRAAVGELFAEDPAPLTISFGIASYPAHGYELGVLMRAADHALYTAKALGRNRTVICNRAIATAISSEVETPTRSRKGRAAA